VSKTAKGRKRGRVYLSHEGRMRKITAEARQLIKDWKALRKEWENL